MKYKFKKGDRVQVKDSYQYPNRFNIEHGMTGTVNENDSENPWVMFDISSANYTSIGTAICDFDLELLTKP